MRIVLQGKRSVFDRDARAFDRVTDSPEIEFEKKRRTLMGNYELFVELPELLIPWKNPIFIQTMSHKVGRLLVPYGLTALLISNLFLLRGFYLVFFGAQIAWYLLAVAGWMVSNRNSKNKQAPQFAAR